MTRSVTEVGPGDFVKVGQKWEKILTNSAHGAERTPREWSITTTSGGTYGMYHVSAYAKASDLNRCPYCDYVTPEPPDGDSGVRGWQEVAHMNTAHPEIVAARLKDSGLEDDRAPFFKPLAARGNIAAMPADTAVQRVYKALLAVQVGFQEAGDEEAEEILLDHVLDPFYDGARRRGEL